MSMSIPHSSIPLICFLVVGFPYFWRYYLQLFYNIQTHTRTLNLIPFINIIILLILLAVLRPKISARNRAFLLQFRFKYRGLKPENRLFK